MSFLPAEKGHAQTFTTLTGPETWKTWFENFESTAKQLRVWKLCDPTVDAEPELLEEPTIPAQPTFSTAIDAAAVNPARLHQWQVSYAIYTDERTRYEKQQDGILKMEDLLRHTVAQRNKIFLEGKTSLWSKVKSLKEKLQPSDTVQKILVRNKLKALATIGSQDPTKWLEKFRTAISEAKRCKLPDVEEAGDLYMFLEAVEPIAPTFANYESYKLKDKIMGNETLPTIDSLIFSWEHDLRLDKAKEATTKLSLASFKGEKQPGSTETTTGSTKGPEKEGNSNRGGNRGKGEWEECLCKMKHRKPACAHCFICNPEIRPEGWEMDPSREAKVKEAFAKDKSLEKKVKDLVDRYNKKKKDEKTAKQAKDSTQTGTCQEYVFSALHILPPALTGRTDLPEEEIYEPPSPKIAASTSRDAILRDSYILDNGSELHITNNLEGFTKTRDPRPGEGVKAGFSKGHIEAVGDKRILVDGDTEKKWITFTETAYIPDYTINVISADILETKGVFYDAEKRLVYQKRPGMKNKVVARLTKHGGLRFLVYDSKGVLEDAYDPHAYATASTEPLKPRVATALRWHSTLGHLGKVPLAKLEEATEGARVTDLDTAPTSTMCEPCALAKSKKKVSRRSTHQEENSEPFSRVGFDLIPMERSYDGKEWCSHLWCYNSKYNLLQNHKKKSQAVHILEGMLQLILVRFKKKVIFLSTDDEQALGDYFLELQRTKGFVWERNAPYASEQNGGNEKAGDIIITKARTMAIASGLPTIYWTEITEAAVYIVNRTPTKSIGYKTPFEAATGVKPTVAHMKAYGCKAYPHKHKGLVPRKHRLDPRAFVGFLVGYDSTNIYRVLVPSLRKILRVRDVTFNEDEFYDHLDPDIGALEDTRELVELIEIGPVEAEAERKIDFFCDWYIPVLIEDRNNEDPSPKGLVAGQSREKEKSLPGPSSSRRQLLTPTPTPPPQSKGDSDDDSDGSDHDGFVDAIEESGSADLQAEETGNTAPRREEVSGTEGPHNIRTGTRERRAPTRFGYVSQRALDTPPGMYAYHAAFNAPLKQKLGRLHRDNLPPVPKNWKQAMASPFAQDWRAAADRHMQEMDRKEAWSWIQGTKVATKDRILPMRWVLSYKFDQDDFLIKLKARICVRGDLQDTDEETYAATLAAKAFRTLMAIAAVWDLDLEQRDAVSAFCNAQQPGNVYCHAPEGYTRPGMFIRLDKALWGLKTSPLLWYNDFTNSLEKLGLQRVPGSPCIYHNEELMCLFHVDDIIEAARPKNRHHLELFDQRLTTRYEMHRSEELKWFLGIRILRDRKDKKLWLNQASYLEKMLGKFSLEKDRCPKSPMQHAVELVPNQGTATKAQIDLYQSKVGSISHAAVMTRPDVSFTHSKLAQFLTNPSAQHMEAADRCIRYLYGSRYLSVQYNGADTYHEAFECASDAAYADDSETRKSSAGWAFKLFGAVVDWRAYKQNTVTTSSTEAELLAISSAAKETIGWIRFFELIGLDLEHKVGLACDNVQTVNLLLKDEPRLNTKLRHVDIHRHWLRQEVRLGKVTPYWIGTKQMMADGFTKALPKDSHEEFVRMLGLVDTQVRIEKEQEKEQATQNKGCSS